MAQWCGAHWTPHTGIPGVVSTNKQTNKQQLYPSWQGPGKPAPPRLKHLRFVTETLGGLAVRLAVLAASEQVPLGALSPFGPDHQTRQQGQKASERLLLLEARLAAKRQRCRKNKKESRELARERKKSAQIPAPLWRPTWGWLRPNKPNIHVEVPLEVPGSRCTLSVTA